MSGRQTRPTPVDSRFARLLIVGMGNPMMGNDGVGHAVVESVARMDLPSRVRVESLAGDVLGLLELWTGESDVWLVDAAFGAAPGELVVVEHLELLGLPPGESTAHQLSLGVCLRWLIFSRPELAGIRLRLFGVGIDRLHREAALSPLIESAAGRVVETLFSEIGDWACVDKRSPTLA